MLDRTIGTGQTHHEVPGVFPEMSQQAQEHYLQGHTGIRHLGLCTCWRLPVRECPLGGAWGSQVNYVTRWKQESKKAAFSTFWLAVPTKLIGHASVGGGTTGPHTLQLGDKGEQRLAGQHASRSRVPHLGFGNSPFRSLSHRDMTITKAQGHERELMAALPNQNLLDRKPRAHPDRGPTALGRM